MQEFVSPFDTLGGPALSEPFGEEVDGSFACQERGCYMVVNTARYLEEVKVLTWKCPADHLSKIEGFNIE